MNEAPNILHIELGNEPIYNWIQKNEYVIFSELIRFSSFLIKENVDSLQTIMVSNLSDNIVFILKKENVKTTLDKAMDYFMYIEEYEKCAEIRDLYILIENLKSNESKNIKNHSSNKRKSKAD